MGLGGAIEKALEGAISEKAKALPALVDDYIALHGHPPPSDLAAAGMAVASMQDSERLEEHRQEGERLEGRRERSQRWAPGGTLLRPPDGWGFDFLSCCASPRKRMPHYECVPIGRAPRISLVADSQTSFTLTSGGSLDGSQTRSRQLSILIDDTGRRSSVVRELPPPLPPRTAGLPAHLAARCRCCMHA